MKLKPESALRMNAAIKALENVGVTYRELSAMLRATDIVQDVNEDAEAYEGQTFEQNIEAYTDIAIDSMDLGDWRRFEYEDITEAAKHLEQ